MLFRSLGGWVVVAHPDSPNPDLRWRSNNIGSDAIEWLNVDSEWRDETPLHWAGTVGRYLLRSPQTIASLFQRPVQTLRRWDMSARGRRVVGLAALDAHARIPWRSGPGEGSTLVAAPSYYQMFRTLAQAVVLDQPLNGDAGADAAAVLAAVKAGRTYSVVTAFAAPARLDFTARSGGAVARMGDETGAVGTTATFHAEANDASARVALLHGGAEIASGRGKLDVTLPITAGPYRVEASRSGMTMPWVISNPIYAGLSADAAIDRPVPPPAMRLVPLPSGGAWAIEKNATSQGSASPDGAGTRFSFTLGPGAPLDQFAALVSAIDQTLSQEGFDRVQFTVRADRPMRFSVQLRLPGSEDRRWRYSVYADQTPRPVTALLQDFQPVNRATSQRPIVARVRSVLFVVDTLNARPGTSGQVWISTPVLGVGQADR